MYEFRPTYLCIKQHKVSKLKYFCKTIKFEKQMLKYLGSGKYWRDHLKKHGKEHVETIWYKFFTDKDECKEFAEFFSEEAGIVNAKDSNGKKVWANLKVENGLWGGSVKGRIILERTRVRQSKSMTGKKLPRTLEHQNKLNKAKTGKKRPTFSDKWRSNMSLVKKGIQKLKIKCPYCPKEGGLPQMKRWHFDNCRERK